MTRELRRIPLGDAIRHRSILTDVPSSGVDVVVRQFGFLTELATNGLAAGLLHCGPLPFESLRMTHNGVAWVVELEATEHQP